MKLEPIIETSSWIIMIVLLLIFVPRDKMREAHIIFFFKQLITWPIGFAVAQMKWIEYPIRFFDNASNTSFTFEYFVYPAIAVLFVLHYPRTSRWNIQCIYYITYSSTLTLIEVILEKYTLLIKYQNWHWYWTWASIILTLSITRKYYIWFFKIR